MKGVHMITYGNNKYFQSKKRLISEAHKSEFFETVTEYGPDDLTSDFKKKNKKILNKYFKGAGFWIWKLDIIKQKLKCIDDNEYLIYLDAGCSINKLGEKRYKEYIEMLEKSNYGIISFQMEHIPERHYTTKEIFDYFNVDIDSEISLSGQLIATVLIMKKNKHLKNIIDLMEKCLIDNSLLFTDNYNKNQNEYFIDNRHDQSVLSVIRKKKGSIVLKDETWFKKFGKKKSLSFPFWATRKK